MMKERWNVMNVMAEEFTFIIITIISFSITEIFHIYTLTVSYILSLSIINNFHTKIILIYTYAYCNLTNSLTISYILSFPILNNFHTKIILVYTYAYCYLTTSFMFPIPINSNIDIAIA